METSNLHDKSGEIVNSLSYQDITDLVDMMLEKGHIVQTNSYDIDGTQLYECTLVPTGEYKHAQTTIPVIKKKESSRVRPSRSTSAVKQRRTDNYAPFPHEGKKILVHHVFYVFYHRRPIDVNLHVSHRHFNPKILALTQETQPMNESRKYCHRFGWFVIDPIENRRRCPHWEAPCLGPNDANVIIE